MADPKATGVCTPLVRWAQRKDHLLVTIELDNVTEPILRIDENTLYFKAAGGSDHKMFELSFNFYKQVVVKGSDTTVKVGSRNIPMKIMKKEEDPYWPRLTSDAKKPFWLKTDFNHWKDEDESEEEGDDPFGGMGGNRFEDMMAQMGGGGAGLGGGDLEEFNDADGEDSDDEPLPDLEEDKEDDK